MFLALAATSAAAGTLTVEVTGISGASGEIGCALHVDGANFPMGAAAVQDWRPADPAGVTCRFDGLKPGAYAIAVSHDLNGNRRTDVNFLGIPTEAWGVSNNVRPRLRAPTFEEARIETRDDDATIAIRIAK